MSRFVRPRAVALVLVATTSLLGACVVAPYDAPYRNGPYARQAPPPVYVQQQPYYVEAPVAPPPPYAEVVPLMPFAAALWIAGYWGWHGGRHEWVPGRWEHDRPGSHYEPHRWDRAGGNWQLRGGQWHDR
jgi:hypothetical protein